MNTFPIEALVSIAECLQNRPFGLEWRTHGLIDKHMSKIACAIYIAHSEEDFLGKGTVSDYINKSHPDTVKTFLLKAVKDGLIKGNKSKPASPPDFLIPTKLFIERIESRLGKEYQYMADCTDKFERIVNNIRLVNDATPPPSIITTRATHSASRAYEHDEHDERRVGV